MGCGIEARKRSSENNSKSSYSDECSDGLKLPAGVTALERNNSLEVKKIELGQEQTVRRFLLSTRYGCKRAKPDSLNSVYSTVGKVDFTALRETNLAVRELKSYTALRLL